MLLVRPHAHVRLLPVRVPRASFFELAGHRIQDHNLLETRIKIASYNQHVSAPPLGWIGLIPITNLTTPEEPATLCDQSCFLTLRL
jgi:hypothetical protein